VTIPVVEFRVKPGRAGFTLYEVGTPPLALVDGISGEIASPAA
jgi:hypothetical protein